MQTYLSTRSDARTKKRVAERLADEFMSSSRPTKKHKAKPKPKDESPETTSDSKTTDTTMEWSEDDTDSDNEPQTELMGPCVSGFDIRTKKDIQFDFTKVDNCGSYHRIRVVYPPHGRWYMALEIGKYCDWACILTKVERALYKTDSLVAQFLLTGNRITEWFESHIDASLRDMVNDPKNQSRIRNKTNTSGPIVYNPIVVYNKTSPTQHIQRVELAQSTQYATAKPLDANFLEPNSEQPLTQDQAQRLWSQGNCPVVLHLSVKHMILRNNSVSPKLDCTKLIFVQQPNMAVPPLSMQFNAVVPPTPPISLPQPIVLAPQPPSQQSSKPPLCRRQKIPKLTERTVMFEQDYKCNTCKVKLPTTWQMDHITRVEHGGTNSRANLQILCDSCHNKKTEMENKKALGLIDDHYFATSE